VHQSEEDAAHLDKWGSRRRDSFAHHVKMSFADNEVQKNCAKFIVEGVTDIPQAAVKMRNRFTNAAVTLILHLNNRPRLIEASGLPLKQIVW
jgi:hypothetical protein